MYLTPELALNPKIVYLRSCEMNWQQGFIPAGCDIRSYMINSLFPQRQRVKMLISTPIAKPKDLYF